MCSFLTLNEHCIEFLLMIISFCIFFLSLFFHADQQTCMYYIMMYMGLCVFVRVYVVCVVNLCLLNGAVQTIVSSSWNRK